MNGDLKFTFVQKCLTDYMREVKEEMHNRITKMKVGVTGEGASSIGSAVINSSAELRFREYLRFIDMGVGRGHPLGGLKATKVNLANKKQGYVLRKDNTRKPKKIYSPVAYGKLNWLIGKLMYGFTEETIAMLKKELEGKS